MPPKADIETRALLKACIEARAALAELKQAGQLIPNQAVLINTIPLLEAQSSSEIENVITTADRLFQYPKRKGPLTRRRRKLCDIAQCCGGAMKTQKNVHLPPQQRHAYAARLRVWKWIRRTPGTTLVDDSTGRVIYTPPEGESRLRDLLANWERFLHEAENIDPVIRMAVQHYQFEVIHPFTDGDGRTGRVLNLLFLIDQGLLDLPVLYLSRAILARKDEYYRLLNAVTKAGRWDEWILYMITAVTETALWTTNKIRAVRQLLDATVHYVKAAAPRIYSHELVELLFVQPYCRIGNVVDAGLAKRETASSYLKRLVQLEVLRDVKIGRERLFLNPRLVALLTSDDPAVAPFPNLVQ